MFLKLFQPVLQQGVAVFGEDAFRMELHAVDRPRPVVQGHHFAILGEGICDQRVRQVIRLDGEGMVADHLIGFRKPLEQVSAGLTDL